MSSAAVIRQKVWLLRGSSVGSLMKVADVPCGGRRVSLALTVRKFVCSTPTCPRKIFTEIP